MAKRKTKSAYEQVTSKLGQLSGEELDELVEVVATLREAMGKTKEEQHSEFVRVSSEDARQGRKPRRGHVEEKMINGYGPYLYLRYWRGGKLKSLYVGKKGASEG